MATIGAQDPNNPGGDWFDQNAPPSSPDPGAYDPNTNPNGTQSLHDAVAQMYRTALGREASEAEIQATIAGGSGDLVTIQKSIYASPEAQAHNLASQKKPNPEPDPAPNPNPTPPPPTIGVPTSGFGAAPTPYASDPNAPQYTPLAPYVAPTWTGGDYVAPTADELYASPGYQSRLDDRLKGEARQYAARGTILNGGTVKALDRSAQDYATNEYQTLNANKYDQYKTRYAQFADAAGRDLASRSVNQADANTTFANRTATYNTGNARTLSDYITNVTNKRNSELDYWSRLDDLNRTGAGAATGSR